jgi:hypothetical protein
MDKSRQKMWAISEISKKNYSNYTITHWAIFSQSGHSVSGTRWLCIHKKSPNTYVCSQTLFRKINSRVLSRKSSPKIWPTTVIFENLPILNNRLIGRLKIAQSGHPGTGVQKWVFLSFWQKKIVIFSWRVQGDQIGRVFAYRPIVYLGRIFEIQKSPIYWATPYHCKSCT